MARKRRGCLFILLGAGFVVVVGLIVGFLMLPGELRLGAPAAPAPAVAPAPGAPAVPGEVPAPAAPTQPAPGGWFTYFVPGDILQAEMRRAFPINQNVVDLVRLRLDDPVFLPDPDGAFLRVRLAVEARVLEGDQRIPGTAVVRTQLGYDRAARRVTLRNTQLAELQFTGAAAGAAGALQPVLAAALAAEMEGYVIFEVPAEGVWWLKAGVGLVRNVHVRDGRVAIALGP